MCSKLDTVLAAIDEANSCDPNRDEGQPEARLYGQRMSAELHRLFPHASDVLQIAARGQHIERWTLPRSAFPLGREGYLTWRSELAIHHAHAVCQLMDQAGYEQSDQETAERMLRKQGIKRDADVQALEDVICFVFLKWYFAPFAAKHPEDKIQRIVEKTARKMSADGRARVLSEFDLPPALAAAFG